MIDVHVYSDVFPLFLDWAMCASYRYEFLCNYITCDVCCRISQHQKHVIIKGRARETEREHPEYRGERYNTVRGGKSVRHIMNNEREMHEMVLNISPSAVHQDVS